MQVKKKKLKLTSLMVPALLLLCLLASADNITAQTLRSTCYDYNPNFERSPTGVPAGYRFDTGLGMDFSEAWTVEAWILPVRLPRETRVGTILAQDRVTGRNIFQFGLLSTGNVEIKLGTSSAESEERERVSMGVWSHIAASYDGVTVRFYKDGSPIGSTALSRLAPYLSTPVMIGALGLPVYAGPVLRFFQIADEFRGCLDEVRVWSVTRTQGEIQNDMNQEKRVAEGLVAVFPLGGEVEVLSGIEGEIVSDRESPLGSGSIQERVIGILPRNLLVPLVPVAPVVDGYVDIEAEYAGAEQMVIRFKGTSTSDGIAYFVHSDEHLYVGVTKFRPSLDGSVGLFLDPGFVRETIPQRQHVQLKGGMDLRHEWLVGDGVSGYEECIHWVEEGPFGSGGFPIPCTPLETEWEVKERLSVDLPPPILFEFRVSKNQLGTWTETDGLMIGQFDVTGSGDDFQAPVGAVWNRPDTWAQVTYNERMLPFPTVRLSGYVFNSASETEISLRIPRKDHKVVLSYSDRPRDVVLEVTKTDDYGHFMFERIVQPGVELSLFLVGCGYCEYDDPWIPRTDIQHIRIIDKREVVFPGCPPGPDNLCVYAEVNFFAHSPPPRR